MPALMRDVATRAGVSITTVSHVLNQTRPVKERTRVRVLEAVEELRYFQNRSARLLVRGQSELFGLIISDVENPFFPELIKSFEQACTRERMELLLCATNYDELQAKNAVRRMLENKVRGVAIMTSQFDRTLETQLIQQNVPIVALSSPPAGKGRSYIGIDYEHGLSQAVRHLYDLGHRSIALATGPLNQVSAQAHKDAVVGAMKNLGLKPFRIIEGDHRPESGARAAKELLQGAQRPTAIFCGNDRMAIGAIGAVLDLGLRVPQEVSLVGSDDTWIARYSYPPLTTVRIPRDALGSLAFEALTRMLSKKTRRGAEYVLETQLIIRGSTDVPGKFAKAQKEHKG